MSKGLEDLIIERVLESVEKVSAENVMKVVKEEFNDFVKTEYGVLPSKVQLVKGDNVHKELQGIFHKKFNDILTLVTNDVPVLLVGGAGSGKNHTLEQVAEALDLSFYFSNAITQEYKLTGFIDANGKYHETQFFKAFTEGGLFFLDEIDASVPEALLTLNSAIANKYFDFPIGRKTAHKDFRVVSAGNTAGLGANHIYTGRQQLDGATTDRFAMVNFDYDENVENALSSNNDIVPFVQSLRNFVEEKALPYVFSMRAIINASKMDGILGDDFVLESIIFKSIPQDELTQFVKHVPSDNRYTKALRDLLGMAPEESKPEETEYTSPTSGKAGNKEEFLRSLGLE